MEPPKLLLHVFSTFATGGAQMRFVAIANHFGPRWRHAIVAMNGDLSCRSRLDPSLLVSYPEIDIRKGDTLGNTRRFRRVLRAMRPNTLVTYNWGSIEWAIANRVRVVHHVHAEDGFGPEEVAGQIQRRVLMRRFMLRGRVVIVPSRNLERIATDIWGLSPRSVRYIPNGIDLSRFSLREVGTSAVPLVGTVAALRGEKNVARLIRAFAIATDGIPARLMVVGDGPELESLRALAASLGIAGHVDFTGRIEDPSALYRGFDVFAMSSDTEQMPISLLEAMGTGLAVATTDVGDIRAMLPAPNHPYVTPRDDAALAAALRALLEQPALRRSLGVANRAQAKHLFDQKDMFAAWAAAMEG